MEIKKREYTWIHDIMISRLQRAIGCYSWMLLVHIPNSELDILPQQLSLRRFRLKLTVHCAQLRIYVSLSKRSKTSLAWFTELSRDILLLWSSTVWYVIAEVFLGIPVDIGWIHPRRVNCLDSPTLGIATQAQKNWMLGYLLWRNDGDGP